MFDEILNNPVYVAWLMIALHIIVDFLCQGNLGFMKQKRWWKKEIKNYEEELNTVLDNAIKRSLLSQAGALMRDLSNVPDKDKIKHIREQYNKIKIDCAQRLSKMYDSDYSVALILHSILWSIVVFAPLIHGRSAICWTIIVVGNAVVHGVVDHLKCNRFSMNLICDQILHFGQMAVTFCLAYRFFH